MHAYSFDVFETPDPSMSRRTWDYKILVSMPKLQIMSDIRWRWEDGRTRAAEMGNTTLRDAYEDPEFSGKAGVVYNYDFGDGWKHELDLVGRDVPGSKARLSISENTTVYCLAGEGHPVAEDCGGLGGWEEIKKGNRMDWYKKHCSNAQRDRKWLDPYKWNIAGVNKALAKTFSPQAL